MIQLQILGAFFRIGILGYGGGPSSIPLFYKEVVDRYKWMTSDEFADLLALANSLPGPIATKLSGYIGYRVAGIMGMIIGLFATITPTIVAMVLLLTTLASYRDLSWVQGMTKAVIPVVGEMLAVLTWQFLVKSKKGLGWVGATVLVVASLVLMQIYNVNPGILIAILLIAALTMKDKKKEGGKTS